MADERAPRTAGEIAEAIWNLYRSIDERVIGLLSRIGLPLLRISLGIVFLWFGALKIAGTTPVADLVADTVYWFDPAWFVPLLGGFEVFVGVFLVLGKLMRLVLLLFGLQMIGTFLVFVVQPEVAFVRDNPLLLTVEGEFVVKNLVLLSAGLVVGSRLRRPRPWT
jgi:putative oxidoreductase